MPGLIPVRKRAGELRHRAELQEGVPTIDELGGRTVTYQAFGNDSVAIDDVPIIRGETDNVVLHTIAMRYRSDLVAKFDANRPIRLIANGKTFKVMKYVNPEQRNRDLILHCGRLA